MQVDKFATFPDHKTIFGRPTIQIFNEIDFDSIPLKQNTATTRELHLMAVVTIHPWHGFDRVIRGLTHYLQYEHREGVELHIVGRGIPAVVDEYHALVEEGAIEQDIIFHGPLFGEPLNRVSDRCRIGISSLGRHRSGITGLRSLKDREYAVRGISFIYLETDADFESTPYILKIPADESPVDTGQVIRFYHSAEEI